MGIRMTSLPSRPVRLVTRKEAAAMFGVSLRHFIDVVDAELPRIYLGRCIRYDVRDIEQLIERWKITLRRLPGGST